jgi:hypothetical protein
MYKLPSLLSVEEHIMSMVKSFGERDVWVEFNSF